MADSVSPIQPPVWIFKKIKCTECDVALSRCELYKHVVRAVPLLRQNLGSPCYKIYLPRYSLKSNSK